MLAAEQAAAPDGRAYREPPLVSRRRSDNDSEMTKTSIFVKLLDEGVVCWRPVDAVEVRPGCYRIVGRNTDPHIERWEFETDQVVRCELRADAGLVAVDVVREPSKEMNRDWVLFHLREAEEELKKTIAEIEATADYGSGEFLVAVTHVYHHVNTAWNSKTESHARVEACEEADFFQWRQFPTDVYLGA